MEIAAKTYISSAVQSSSSATSVSQGGVTFPFTTSQTVGNFDDGPCWVYLPSGLTASMNEPTPIESLDGSDLVNGAQVNPVLTNDQGYDQRSSASYWDGALTQSTWPLTVSAGDVITKIKSEAVPVEARNGLPAEVAACFILDYIPPENSLSPAAIGWTGRSSLDVSIIDVATKVAALTSFDTSTHTVPTYATIMAALDFYNPLYAQGSAQDSQFHSELMVADTVPSDYNYGRNIGGDCIGNGLNALISDDFSASEKQAIAKRIISMGKNWYDTFSNTPSYLDENGAILQFHFAAMALYLSWSGQTAALADLGDSSKFAGNFAQAIQITASDITNMTPHDSTTQPYPWRRRTIPSGGVTGLVVTVPELSSGEAGDPAANCVFDGMILTRESDSATAVVQSAAYDSGNSEWDLTIDAQPGTAFAASDVVYCEVPANAAPSADDYDWSLSGRRNFSHYNPMPGAAYRNLNKWSSQLFFLKAAGIWHSSWDTAWEYVKRANTANTPHADYDFASHFQTAWDSEMWSDYLASVDV